MIARLPGEWGGKGDGGTFVAPETAGIFLGLCHWREL